MQLLLAIGLTLSLIVITSCTTQSEKAAGIEGAEDTDSLMVVDCLLPGQVRQLGSRARYVTPRRPVKTTSSDCGIRGGEFTAYDRADYATSLKIWLPQAQAGDAEAQAYVGEIFEKGLGVPADYQAAAVWYEKAAAQNLPRAQINLANLYEKGLGVEKDNIMALNLYRRAAGLSGDSLQYASTILASNQLKNSLQEQQQIITDLQQEKQVLRSRQQILQEKNRELAQINDVLMQDKKTLVTEQSVLKSAQAEWETERQQLISSIDVTSAGVASVQPGIAAPEIQIIDPPITLTRSGASVLLSESVPKIEIVGKITSPIGIKTARINNLPLTTDEFDLFFASIPVDGVRTEVNIVAHDKQNNQSRFDFVLFNDEGQIRPENASFQARPAKKQNTLAPKLGVDFGEYHALVIGNNEYQHFPKLNTAVNDARAVARVLRQQYGFNVTLLVNARRYDILAALDRLRRSLTERDNLLIYYAGHGELEETSHEGYWLGVDAAPIFASNWLSNLTLSDQLNTFKADQIMVVADSCYAGTFSTASIARSAVQIKNSAYQNWLEVMVDVRARTVLTSGGTRPVLDSLGGEHSLFAQAFIDVLENNHTIIDGNSIYINILNAMSKHNQPGQYRQVPDYGAIKFAGHEAGEFFLTPKTL